MRMNSAPLHSAPLRSDSSQHCCDALRHAARPIGHGRRARGELVQRALLVGLGVQPRCHGEECVEAQQHLREYQRPQPPRPPAPPESRVPRVRTAGAVGVLSAVPADAAQWLQRTSAATLQGDSGVLKGGAWSASSKNCERPSNRIAFACSAPRGGALRTIRVLQCRAAPGVP